MSCVYDAMAHGAGTGGTGYSAVQMAKIFGAKSKAGVKVVTAAGGDNGVAFLRCRLAPIRPQRHR